MDLSKNLHAQGVIFTPEDQFLNSREKEDEWSAIKWRL